MPATTLYLIRHGEADHGEIEEDPGLSSLGRRQAAAVGSRLARLEVSSVLHSSRRRAVESAAIIAESIANAVAVQSDLAEDLTPIPDDVSDVPAEYRDFLRSVPENERDLGGQRLDHAVAELSRVGDVDSTMLVVTHNFVIGWFVRHALDAPRWRWIGLNQANGAMSIIRYEPGRSARLVAFNDRGHVAELR